MTWSYGWQLDEVEVGGKKYTYIMTPMDSACRILNRLKNFSGKQLKKSFIDSVVRAINSHDEEDMMWLDYLSELLDNKELKEELSEEILNILEKHYNHWGYWRSEK